MNNYILDLIKEAVDKDNESNINRLYRMVWINILEQFKKNPVNYDISLWVKEKNNDYYNLIYYNDGKLTEILFKMTKEDRETLKQMLLDDGFTINNSIIKISREKIIDYAKGEKEPVKKQKIINYAEVPSTNISMIDETKIKKH